MANPGREEPSVENTFKGLSQGSVTVSSIKDGKSRKLAENSNMAIWEKPVLDFTNYRRAPDSRKHEQSQSTLKMVSELRSESATESVAYRNCFK